MEIRPEQSSAMRHDIFAERLVEMFQSGGKEAAFDPAADQVVVKDAKGNPTRLGFDDQGFIGNIISPMGRKWTLENDPEGKLLGIRNPAGLHLGFDYSEEGDIIRIRRNGQSLLHLDYEYKATPRSVTFPDGTSTEFRYNERVKLTDLHTRRGVKEHYEYDADGDLTAITDGNGNRTQFEYGMWNRPDRTRYPDGSSEQYQYTPEGLLQRLIAVDGTRAEIDYTEAGKPKEIRYSDGQVLRFEYNGQGQITQAQNAEATLNYTYDGEGRLLSEECDGQTATYHYDEIGALAGITYPSGETVEFEYDADQRLTAVKDWQGQYHRFTYLEKDGGVEHQAPNGVTTVTQLSPLGQPVDISARGPGNRPLFRFSYRYDNEDRVESFSDSDFGSRSYEYDADNQLIGVHSQDKAQLNERFAYDVAGNRTECNGEKARFNGLNQLLEQGQSQCAYDERGNLIEYRASGEVWRYTFDARNQLIRAESSKGTDVRFGYDAFGRRLWKREVHRETSFFWLGENLIGETLQQDDQLLSSREYLYVIGTFAPMAAQINGEVYSYHYDNVGTPRRLTDKHGKVVWAADYEAFGESLVRVKGVESNFRFPGQYFDLETGLHYNRFRYYSPVFGRYLNKDPLGHVGGINLYNFIGNSTPNQADGFGLFWKTVAAIGAGIAVGALVVLTAPVSAPIALGLGLAAGGFTAGALNEGLNNGFNLKCMLMEGIHGMLDALGFIPGIGEIFDAINGVIYLAEGRYLEAGLSFASMIPFGDWLAKPMKWMSKTPLAKVLIEAATPAVKKVLDSKVIKATKETIKDVASKLGDTKVVKETQKIFEETGEAVQKLKDDWWPSSKKPPKKKLPQAENVDDTIADATKARVDKSVSSTRGKNTANWEVDEYGRPISAEIHLKEDFGTTRRSSAEVKDQQTIGKSGIEGDEGGHLISHRFIGDQGAKNLFPQNANLNRSAFKKMENEWADWIDNGKEIEAKIELIKTPGSVRPKNIVVEYKVIDPETGKIIKKRRHNFNNSADETFKRIPKSTMK